MGFGALGPADWTDEDAPPSTGTALDEFLPIYWWMARATRLHGPHSASEVDALDLSVLAALLGVQADRPDDPFGSLSGDFAADSARLIRRRQEQARKAKANGGSTEP